MQRLLRGDRELQSGACNRWTQGIPLKQKRERERFFIEEGKEAEKGLYKQFLLLGSVFGAGHKSSPFWPQDFSLNEVSTDSFFTTA